MVAYVLPETRKAIEAVADDRGVSVGAYLDGVLELLPPLVLRHSKLEANN